MRVLKLLLLLLVSVIARSQTITTVGGETTTGGSGVCLANPFSNPSNVNTSSPTDYAQYYLLASTGCNYYLHSTLSSVGAAGTEAGFRIRMGNLTSLLSGITISTYLNGVWQESASGSDFLSVFNGQDGNISFRTTKAYDALRISFNGLATAGNIIRIYWGYGDNTAVQTLPISFRNFKIKEVAEMIRLDWDLENSSDFKNIKVEKSFNFRDYTTIGVVNKQNNTTYTYMDQPGAKAWYRLRVDFKSGKVLYSPVVFYTPSYRFAISLYPNPVTGNYLHIRSHSISDQAHFYFIADALGREIKKGVLTRDLKIDVSSFEKGLYFFKSNTGESLQFWKQ